MPEPTINKLTSMHFYGWQRGLKTGSYYIRSEPARDAIKFTINKDVINEKVTQEPEKIEDYAASQLCSLDNPENCDTCSA